MPKGRMPKKNRPVYTQEQIEALKSRALELWSVDNRRAHELGLALIEVRTALSSQHGAFKKWWQDNKLSQARVSYCMRKASGKMAAAKAKLRTLERLVAAKLKTEVDDFFKSCTNKNTQTLDQIDASLSRLYLHLIGAVQRVRGWQRINDQDPNVLAATKNFKTALSELLDAAFQPITFEDLDRIHPDRIHLPIKASPVSDTEFKQLVTPLRRGMSVKPAAGAPTE